jgi:hypothetical protein
MKRASKTARLTTEQREWLEAMAGFGHYAAVCWGARAAKACLAWYVDPPGTRQVDACDTFDVRWGCLEAPVGAIYAWRPATWAVWDFIGRVRHE